MPHEVSKSLVTSMRAPAVGTMRSLRYDGSARSEGSGPAAARHVKVPTFEKTKKYAGHRLGRVFKLGLAGLGYYADNGPVV